MSQHPCPKPSIGKRQRFDGLMWACTCGRIYVLRFKFTYASDWWEWVSTELETREEGS